MGGRRTTVLAEFSCERSAWAADADFSIFRGKPGGADTSGERSGAMAIDGYVFIDSFAGGVAGAFRRLLDLGRRFSFATGYEFRFRKRCGGCRRRGRDPGDGGIDGAGDCVAVG